MQERKKKGQLYVQYFNFIYFNLPWVSQSNKREKAEHQQELNLWGLSQSSYIINWKTFDFSLVRFPIVDIYENMHKIWSFNWTS